VTSLFGQSILFGKRQELNFISGYYPYLAVEWPHYTLPAFKSLFLSAKEYIVVHNAAERK
jgi:hypothetical protein